MATIRERNQALEEKQTQYQMYKSQVTELIAERDELSHELLQNLCTQGTSRSASPPATTKSTKLPDPPVFLGMLDPPVEDWLSKVRSKLRANHDYYPTEDIRIGYIENRVGGIATKHLVPQLRAGATNPFKSADEMLETLEQVYRDPNCCTTALQEFRKLYQGNRDFNSFWAEFQRLAAEIDYSPETLIDKLHNKVSVDLEQAIITELDLVDVYTLARKCQQYNINIQRLKARKAKFLSRSRTTPQNLTQVQASYERTLATPATTTSPVPCTTFPCVPITPSERQKLQAENKCFYCKREGHRALECPAKVRTKLTTVNLVSTIPDQVDQGKESS